MDASFHSAITESSSFTTLNTQSGRVKPQRMKNTSAIHNSNFRAGHVPVREEALHQSGIRGCKRHCLYCILRFMVVVALLNVMVTAWLIYILGITHNGMATVELGAGARQMLRVLSDAHIITLRINEAPLGARYNSSLDLVSQTPLLKVGPSPMNLSSSSSINMSGSNITFNTNQLYFMSKQSNAKLPVGFESVASNFFISVIQVDDLVTQEIKAVRNYKDLFLESGLYDVSLQGTGGVQVTSDADVEVSAKAIVDIESQESITLNGEQGVFINSALSKTDLHKAAPHGRQAYKVCVCETGKLFLASESGPGSSCHVDQSKIKKLCQIKT